MVDTVRVDVDMRRCRGCSITRAEPEQCLSNRDTLLVACRLSYLPWVALHFDIVEQEGLQSILSVDAGCNLQAGNLFKAFLSVKAVEEFRRSS